MKKTLSLLTALLLACTGMTACGAKEDSSTENTNESSVTVTEENSEAETEEITEADTTEVTTTEEVTTEAKTCPLSEMTIDEFESRFNELIPPLFEEEFTKMELDSSKFCLSNREYEDLGEYGTACTYWLYGTFKLYVFESENGTGIEEITFEYFPNCGSLGGEAESAEKYYTRNQYPLSEQIIASIFMFTKDFNNLKELHDFYLYTVAAYLAPLRNNEEEAYYIEDSIGYRVDSGPFSSYARIVVNPQ